MTKLIIHAIEQWYKNGDNIYNWLSPEDVREIADLIEKAITSQSIERANDE